MILKIPEIKIAYNFSKKEFKNYKLELKKDFNDMKNENHIFIYYILIVLFFILMFFYSIYNSKKHK